MPPNTTHTSSPAATSVEDARYQGNLRLVQRGCMPPGRTVRDILGTATFVVLYEFDGGQWKKCGTEGPLFVVSSTDTSQSLQYHLCVTNRLSVQNFVRTLTPAWDIQHQPPYLIVRPDVASSSTSGGPNTTVPSSPSYGVWFTDAVEAHAVFDVLQTTLKLVTAAPPPPPVPPAPPAPAVPATHQTTAPTMDTNVEAMNTAAAALTLKTVLGIVDPATSNDSTNTNAATNPSPVAVSQPPLSAPDSSVLPAQLVLDKTALQLSLLSLIQDDRFLDLLHTQYIRVLKTARSRASATSDPESSAPPPQPTL